MRFTLQINLLLSALRDGKKSIKELQLITHYNYCNIYPVLQRLEDNGYIERNDLGLIKLTSKGINYIQLCSKA